MPGGPAVDEGVGVNYTCGNLQSIKGPVRKIVEDWLPPVATLEVFEFDREGNQVRKPAAACVTQAVDTRIHADGGRTEVQTISGGDFWSTAALNGFGFRTPGAALAETAFTAENVPIETLFRNKDGTATARIRYMHDEKRRISEAVRYPIAPPALPPQTAAWARTATPSALGPLACELDLNVAVSMTFKYDDDGRLLETCEFYDSRLSLRSSNTYNKHGDIETVTQNWAGREAHFRYEYEYDKWGNWIRQLAWGPFGDVHECHREITYYE